MKYVLIPLIVALMIMVVVSLVRGIAAFLASTRDDLEQNRGPGPSALQLKQNRMMFARIKFQLAAIVVVAILAALSR